jgi:hypothetical protein
MRLWNLRFSNPLLDAKTFEFDVSNMIIGIGSRILDSDYVKGQYMGLIMLSSGGETIFNSELENLSADNLR